MLSFDKFKMFISLVLIVVATVLLPSRKAQAISVGLANFASTANGGSAVSNGSNAVRAIDGVIPTSGSTANAASWNPTSGAVWTGTLATESALGEVSEIRVYDRGCCGSIGPYTIELLDASDATIFTDSYAAAPPQGRPAIFLPPAVSGAVKVRLSHTGGSASDSYLHEVEVIGFNSHVSGLGVIGTDTLASTISGGTTPGDIVGARVAQLTLNRTTTPPDLRADIVEFRVFDTGATNVALAGTGFHRLDGGAAPFGNTATTTGGDGPLLNDDNLSTFSDMLSGAGDFYGIELAGVTTLSSVQLENRNCCTGHGDMQLQIFSDTARTDLIYDAAVNVNGAANDITNLGFILGGIADGFMEDGRTYVMELDTLGSASDMLSVTQAQATSTRLTVDGNLIVTLLNDIPTSGDTFQILGADSFLGTFDSITLPSLSGGQFWNTSQLLINGTISVVPEPSTLLLLGLGILGLVGRTRRRRENQKTYAKR